MDTITLDGEKYVKAGSIAQELGYTADYVGQLCRGGKVKAQLVGRSWYVQPDSLHGHKSTRYRSAAKKSKVAVKEMLTNRAKETPSVTSAVAVKTDRPNFYKQVKPTVAYEEDTNELIPTLQERELDAPTAPRTRLRVTPAGAEKVTVNSEGDRYVVNKSDLPDFTLQGTLDIRDADPDPKDLNVKSSDRARKVSVKALKLKKPAFKERVANREVPVTPIASQEPISTPESVQMPVTSQSVSVARQVSIIAGAVCVSLLISLTVIGAEQRVSIVEGVDFSSYELSYNTVVQSLKNLSK